MLACNCILLRSTIASRTLIVNSDFLSAHINQLVRKTKMSIMISINGQIAWPLLKLQRLGIFQKYPGDALSEESARLGAHWKLTRELLGAHLV